MEIKETANLPTSVEINVKQLSDRNDPNKHSVYDLLFPRKEDADELNIDDKGSQTYHQRPLYKNVSTLDWLATWRPLEIS